MYILATLAYAYSPWAAQMLRADFVIYTIYIHICIHSHEYPSTSFYLDAGVRSLHAKQQSQDVVL